MSYTPSERNVIASNLLITYPPSTLASLSKSFTWKNVSMPEAWNTRVALAHALQTQLDIGAAQDVHKWGFGRQFHPLSTNPIYRKTILNGINVFRTNPQRSALEPALVDMLKLPGVGISKASKWTCFANQERFAIFDSRVSIALRNVMVDDTHRAFPIIARRATGQRRPFPQDAAANSPSRMSKAYLDFIDVVEIVSLSAGLPTAHVEMALFMAGNVWNTPSVKLRPLRPGLW